MGLSFICEIQNQQFAPGRLICHIRHAFWDERLQTRLWEIQHATGSSGT